jgi:membrane fusion protein (multidrug efflux system)
MNEKEYLDFIQNAKGDTKEDKIKNLAEVTLILANGTKYGSKGRIETINSQIDKATGTVSFRAEFNNENRLLNNGNSGTIKVPKVYINAIVVPQEATFENQNNRFVYIIKTDTTNTTLAVSRAITIKGASDNLFIIKNGLEKGEIIIAKGVSKIKDGTPVTPQKRAFDSIAQPIKTEFQ